MIIMNNVEVNMGPQISPQGLDFISLNIYAEVGLLDHMVVLLLIFLRHFHTGFQDGCTNFHAWQRSPRVAFSTHPHQHLLSFVFNNRQQI